MIGVALRCPGCPGREDHAAITSSTPEFTAEDRLRYQAMLRKWRRLTQAAKFALLGGVGLAAGAAIATLVVSRSRAGKGAGAGGKKS